MMHIEKDDTELRAAIKRLTDRLFAHESALQQRIAELEKQYEARGLVVKCQRARIDELEFAIGNPSLLARVDSKQRLAEMVDNEFKLAERIAELEERNERLTRENGSTLLALSKAERELAAEKYEHLHSINQRDGLYVQLEAFKAKVLGGRKMYAIFHAPDEDGELEADVVNDEKFSTAFYDADCPPIRECWVYMVPVDVVEGEK